MTREQAHAVGLGLREKLSGKPTKHEKLIAAAERSLIPVFHHMGLKLCFYHCILVVQGRPTDRFPTC